MIAAALIASPFANPLSASMPLLFGAVMSPWTMLILLVIVFLIFGNKLPELARNFGKGINEFKKGLKEGGEEEANKELPRSGDAKPEDAKSEDAKSKDAKPKDRVS